MLADGSVVVPVLTGVDNRCLGAYCYGSEEFHPALQLVFVRPDGSTTVHTVFSDWLNSGGVLPYKAIPNGQGGVLVAWDHFDLTGAPRISAYVAGVASDGRVRGITRLGDTWGDLGAGFGGLVLGEQGQIVATTYYRGRRSLLHLLTPEGYPMTWWDFSPRHVSTVLAGSGGSFVTNLSDGTVYGDDPDFELMHLTKAQYFEYGTWLGGGSPRLVSMAGPVFSLANTQWPTELGGTQSPQAAVNPGQGVYVKGHEVLFENYHTSIRIVPRHQDLWRQRRPHDFINQDRFGNYFATIGAGSSQIVGCGGMLVSDVNRSRDVSEPWTDIELVPYSPALEDSVIERLFQLDSHYPDNLAYDCWPPEEGQGYNSNSYTSGLLLAAKVGLVRFPVVKRDVYPGWTKPVPPAKFQAHQ